jgi:hypothetical protein
MRFLNKHNHSAWRGMYRKSPIYAKTHWAQRMFETPGEYLRKGYRRPFGKNAQRVLETIWVALQTCSVEAHTMKCGNNIRDPLSSQCPSVSSAVFIGCLKTKTPQDKAVSRFEFVWWICTIPEYIYIYVNPQKKVSPLLPGSVKDK